MNFLSLLAVGLAAFVSTNTDNLFLLMILFAERRIAPRNIVAGAYVACAIVLAISALSLLLKEAIPAHWLALLGVVPLTIGLSRALRLLWRPAEDGQPKPRPARRSALSVTLLALAISGDNIGVYSALFPSQAPWKVEVLMVQFLLLLGLWCAIARYLATHRALSTLLDNAAHAIMPLVLIGIGVLILSRLFR